MLSTVLYFSACSNYIKVQKTPSNSETQSNSNKVTYVAPPLNDGTLDVKVKDKEGNPVRSKFNIRHSELTTHENGSMASNYICIQNYALNEETQAKGNGPTYSVAPPSSENVAQKVCFTLNSYVPISTDKRSPPPIKIGTYFAASKVGESEPDKISTLNIVTDETDDYRVDFNHLNGSITIESVDGGETNRRISLSGRISLQDNDSSISGNFTISARNKRY